MKRLKSIFDIKMEKVLANWNAEIVLSRKNCFLFFRIPYRQIIFNFLYDGKNTCEKNEHIEIKAFF